MGIEPTGTEVEFRSIAVVRTEDGKHVEAWAHADTMGLVQQLGVVELPGE